MLIAIVVAAAGLGLICFGAKGFSQDGIPLTYDCNLNGNTGRCIGVACLLVGSPIVIAGVLLLLVSAGR